MSNITDIVYIMDRSGSMANLMTDAIGGVNTFVKKQKEIPGECYFTLVTFNEGVRTMTHRVPLAEVKEVTNKEIFASGGTALYDAIGETLSSITESWNVVVVIMTDGEENASKEWTKEKVKALIESRPNWEFQFTGVGIDGFAAGTSIGLKGTQTNSVDYSDKGVRAYTSSHIATATAYRTR